VKNTRKLKAISVLLATLVLFACIPSVADGPTVANESAIAETRLQGAPDATEQQRVSPPAPDEPASQENNQELQELDQPTEPYAEPLSDETPPALTEEVADEIPPEDAVEGPESVELPLAEAPERLLCCIVRWVLDATDSLLFWGDTLTLEAEITSEMTGLQLQWQVAAKPTKLLEENEDEWADIPGARDLKHTFAVEEGMQTWRWRLLIALPDGEAMFSHEMMLPPVAPGGGAEAQEEAVPSAEDADALPVAIITFTADAPADEISFGTRIELVAEIDNPREGMLLQWQYMPMVDAFAEDAWQDVPGATETTHAYVLDEENANWLWRLLITVPEASDKVSDDVTDEDAEPLILEDFSTPMLMPA